MNKKGKIFAIVLLGILLILPMAGAWDTNGTPICAADSIQEDIAICPDGAGGAIIVWRDWRAPGDLGDIYAQRIDSDGVGLWGANGTAICTE
ncbi:MAG TPA: hypothetical protein VMV49_14840, partial [Candidatus Deferrimicrobium sp.]|nr:hypothetical protein [Candidatus Deferrimicrobium sp.]